MSIYNDFLDRRMELEGGAGPVMSSGPVGGSATADGVGLSSLAGAVAINGTSLNNVPNISSPEAATILQNISPAMEATVQVQAIAAATLQSAISNQVAINASQSLSTPLLNTVQPADIAAAAVISSSPVQVNLQIMPEGFGSYLDGILPNDLATAAGAFSATMQQVKNIRNIPIEKFAQVAATLETTRGLNLVNGTDVPADVTEAAKALKLIALGSGPYNTYTFSDFFGCMSGLPYPWAQIQPAIIGLQSNKLATIYQNLWLALTWRQATASVYPGYSTSASPAGIDYYDYYYQIESINGIASFDGGGGYGRDGAAAPTATIDGGSGATIITTIDTIPAVNDGSTTFGKILSGLLGSHGSSVYYGSGSSPTPPAPPSTLSVTIQAPPALSPNLNTVVQNYINQANSEIAIIRSTHPGQAVELNDMWDNLGTQLGIEQRARNAGLSLVPSPRVDSLYPYPTMIYSFTDLVPTYAKATQPNMSVQTLEAISDQDKNAGQSIIAMMRAERNKARLLAAGITTDDTIEDILPQEKEIALIANGTLSWTPPGVTPTASNTLTSAPAFPFNTEPAGYFDPATKNFLVTKMPVQTNPNQAVSPNNPANPFNTTTPTNPITNPSQNTINVQPSILGAPSPAVAAVLGIGTPGNIPIITGDIGIGSPGISAAAAGVVNNGTGVGGTGGPGAGGTAPGGGGVVGGVVVAPGFFAGPGAGGGLGGQGGGPIVPGSLAGSPYTKLIPPSLNPIYTSAVLLPASLPVQAAIEEVIKCNCDCWIQ